MFQFNYTANKTPYAITVSMVTIILNCELYPWRGVVDTVGKWSSLAFPGYSIQSVCSQVCGISGIFRFLTSVTCKYS